MDFKGYFTTGDGKRCEPLVKTPNHWRLPVLFYGIAASGNLLLAIPVSTAISTPAIVRDPSGRQWLTSDIIGTCLLTSLFVMGTLALLAWVQLSRQITALPTVRNISPRSAYRQEELEDK